jgi:hypothetical protein
MTLISFQRSQQFLNKEENLRIGFHVIDSEAQVALLLMATMIYIEASLLE